MTTTAQPVTDGAARREGAEPVPQRSRRGLPWGKIAAWAVMGRRAVRQPRV